MWKSEAHVSLSIKWSNIRSLKNFFFCITMHIIIAVLDKGLGINTILDFRETYE